MKFVRGARALFALVLAAVTYLTLTPVPDQAKAGFDLADWIARLLFDDGRLGDKVAHFSAYAALGLTAAAGNIRFGGSRAATMLALAGYGALLEGAQGFGLVRTPDFFDGLANFLGASTGFATTEAMRALIRSKAAA